MDDNPFQPGAKVHVISTNQDGLLKRIVDKIYFVDLPTGEQISVVSGDIEYRPAAGERPILGEDTSSRLDG